MKLANELETEVKFGSGQPLWLAEMRFFMRLPFERPGKMRRRQTNGVSNWKVDRVFCR